MAKVKTIHYISRASIKIKDSYFTFEYGEDRELDEGENLEEARAQLVADCDNEIDNCIIETKKALGY